MSCPSLSAFDDKSRPPDSADLAKVLGRALSPWDDLIAHIEATYPPITQVWSFAGAEYGWSLRLKCRDRVVLYMTPQAGVFLLGLVLGEKAAQASREMDLPDSVHPLIDAAPRYAEGRGIRLPVATGDDLAAVRTLAALKMAKR